jgi:hypothetical protein
MFKMLSGLYPVEAPLVRPLDETPYRQEGWILTDEETEEDEEHKREVLKATWTIHCLPADLSDRSWVKLSGMNLRAPKSRDVLRFSSLAGRDKNGTKLLPRAEADRLLNRDVGLPILRQTDNTRKYWCRERKRLLTAVTFVKST